MVHQERTLKKGRAPSGLLLVVVDSSSVEIYQILPQLIELWGLNVQTEVESRKNLAKVSGK